MSEPSTDARLLEEIEARVRATICPTFSSRDGMMEERLEGRISAADFDALLAELAALREVADAAEIALPLAKGYAAEHPVGSNAAYVAAHAAKLGLTARLSGERNGRAKLTAEQVTAIRELRGREGQRAIAARFGVARSLVQRIHQGKAWAEWPEDLRVREWPEDRRA